MSVFTNPAGRNLEQAKAYVAATLDLLGNRDPLEVLRATPDALADAVAGLDERALRQPEAPGKWSIAHVVDHLADTELVYAFRFRILIAHEKPEIAGFDQDAWSSRLGYGTYDVQERLALHRAVRGANVRLLASRPPADFEKVGEHSERGPESLGLVVKLAAGHDVLHLAQVQRIRKTLA